MGAKSFEEVLNVSENIRRIRLRKGLSQRQLADLVGNNQGAIARWEQPICSITLDSLRRVAEALEVEIKDLLEAP